MKKWVLIAVLVASVILICRPQKTPDASLPSDVAGIVMLTEEKNVLTMDLATQMMTSLCSMEKLVKYAVPLGSLNELAIVTSESNDGPDRLSLYSVPNRIATEVARGDRIGLPTLSPDGSRLAWVVASSNESRLHVADVRAPVNPDTVEGNFAVDNTGPGWLQGEGLTDCLAVALNSQEIGILDLERRGMKIVCKGELPALLPDRKRFLFYRDESLWAFDIEKGSESHVIKANYIHWSYRACQTSSDGRYALFRTLYVQKRIRYSVPSLLLIDVAGKRFTVFHQNRGDRGPWAWVKSSP